VSELDELDEYQRLLEVERRWTTRHGGDRPERLLPIPCSGDYECSAPPHIEGCFSQDRDVIPTPPPWSAPSADPSVLAQQYADAAAAVELRNEAMIEMVRNWRAIEVHPGAEGSLLMALSFVFFMLNAELAGWDPECTTCEPKISRPTALLVQEMAKASMAQIYTLSKVVDGAFDHLDQAEALLHMSNLRAAGMHALADELSDR
jgi:hypothetical protein